MSYVPVEAIYCLPCCDDLVVFSVFLIFYYSFFSTLFNCLHCLNPKRKIIFILSILNCKWMCSGSDFFINNNYLNNEYVWTYQLKMKKCKKKDVSKRQTFNFQFKFYGIQVIFKACQKNTLLLNKFSPHRTKLKSF